MDLWFGDSWPIGEELGQDTDIIDQTVFPNAVVGLGRDNPLKAFSTLVSKHRNKKFINFSMSASSIDFALLQLILFCKNRKDVLEDITEQHTAFLCTTAQIRGYGYDHILNKNIHYFNDHRKSITPIYDSIVAINSFYTLCNMYKIRCIIIPIFCDLIIPDTLERIVLFDDSILTRTSLVELTFGQKFIDDRLYDQSVSENEIYKHLASKEWISQYRGLHPNVIGHRKLAYKLIELLENC